MTPTPFTYLSICSGIEAASVAWEPLGWKPCGFAEIEKFPSTVLAHHWPEVPNLGDMTKYHEWPDTLRPHLIVGGTPCQAFSVAGLRKGLADPRGNLTLTFLAILARYRPEWVVWENVPGVLSDQTGAFGAFLGGLGELGYGTAYRVLDAQYFGVAQRRRRVFVVGHLGDWRRAAAVLFERESLRGDPAPSRQKGQRIAACLGSCPAASSQPNVGNGQGTVVEVHAFDAYNQESTGDLSKTVSARNDNDTASLIAGTLDSRHAGGFQSVQSAAPNYLIREVSDVTRPLTAAMGTKWNGNGDLESRLIPELILPETTGTICADSHPGSYTGQDAYTGRLIPSVVAFDTTQITSPSNYSSPQPGDPCHPLAAGAHAPAVAFAIQAGAIKENPNHGPDGVGVRSDDQAYTLEARAEVQAVAFAQNTRDEVREMHVVGALAAEPGMKQTSYIRQQMQVRRLTPRECERLQGFPDDHTLVPWRGKMAPDGPRYKALGNSMAVPVMRWIGQRIAHLNRDHPTPFPQQETQQDNNNNTTR
jgi:DNA (cytosine-5)-methyltransferase 1